MVYFCAFTHSEILPKITRELGMGREQFLSGVNGLSQWSDYSPIPARYFSVLSVELFFKNGHTAILVGGVHILRCTSLGGWGQGWVM